MPTYSFQCNKCKEHFEEICTFAECDAKFPDIKCPHCNSKSLRKNISIEMGFIPGAVFSNPRESSKWDNDSFRAGHCMNKAKLERAAADAKSGGVQPYKHIDDTQGGKRMNFID